MYLISFLPFFCASGGMRGSRLLLCETSQVDPVEGISYRGIPIRELIELLPKATPESPPPTEALFWLLLTGECGREYNRMGEHLTDYLFHLSFR